MTERPREGLWLVAVLFGLRRDKQGWIARVMNTVPVVDVTALREVIGPRRRGKPVVVLDARRAAILDEVRIAASHARDHVIEWDDGWSVATAPPAPAEPTKRKIPKLPKLAGELGPGCLAQIESVLEELRERPQRFLSRPGAFVTDVQNIYDGVVDTAEATRMLRDELAPFVRREGPRKLNAVAIRAVDELCRGMVALALGREEDVPASCAPLRTPLARYAAVVKKMLAS